MRFPRSSSRDLFCHWRRDRSRMGGQHGQPAPPAPRRAMANLCLRRRRAFWLPLSLFHRSETRPACRGGTNCVSLAVVDRRILRISSWGTAASGPYFRGRNRVFRRCSDRPAGRGRIKYGTRKHRAFGLCACLPLRPHVVRILPDVTAFWCGADHRRHNLLPCGRGPLLGRTSDDRSYRLAKFSLRLGDRLLRWVLGLLASPSSHGMSG